MLRLFLTFLLVFLPSSLLLATELRVLISGSVNQTAIIQNISQLFSQQYPSIKVAIQTGNSLEIQQMAREGKADLLISHYEKGDKALITEGFGIISAKFMFNKFAIFGPKEDPLKLRNKQSLKEVLISLHENEVDFYVPSQLSGTFKKIEQLWQHFSIDPNWIGYENSQQSGPSTLKAANDLGYYTFIDLSSYVVNKLNVRNIAPLFRDDALLNNYYSVMVLNENKINSNSQHQAELFFNFMTSKKIQQFIAEYGIKQFNYDLYFPYATFDKNLIDRKKRHQAEDKTLLIYTFMGLIAVIILSLWLVLIKQNQKAQSDHLAYYDSLTTIGNRRLFIQDSEKLIKNKSPFALLLLDLNGFKKVNDQYGHEFGDEVLIQIAQRLATFLDKQGQIYRLGGDEFVIHLYDLFEIDGALVKQIASVIEQKIVYNDISLSTSANIGVTFFPEHHQALDKLLHMTDKAMYSAKQNNQLYAIYSS